MVDPMEIGNLVYETVLLLPDSIVGPLKSKAYMLYIDPARKI